MKIVDRYSLHARFYPMVLFYMPVLLLGTLFSFQFEKYTHLLTSLGLLGALSFFLQQIGRDAGKKREKKLWEDWGGPPSTQLLRWRDETFDNNTKKRYHIKLQENCPLEVAPDQEFESKHPKEADASYQAWIKFLITKNRDTAKFPLLFTENISYGFRRNVLGLKPYSVALLIALMIISYSYFVVISKSFSPTYFPYLFFSAEGGLLIILLMWIIKIKSDWVRIPANAYAERLLEAIDSLKKEKLAEKPKGKKK